MSEYLKTLKEYSLISTRTPLLSNLNMVENIALVKEVIFNIPTKKAQAIADDLLQKIDLSHISLYRVQQCSTLEIFFVMFIRALMSKENIIVIESPYLIVQELIDIEKLISTIHLLNASVDKNIIILDFENNATHYEGCKCNTIK